MSTAERMWHDAKIDVIEAQARLAEADAAVHRERGSRLANASAQEAKRLWEKARRLASV